MRIEKGIASLSESTVISRSMPSMKKKSTMPNARMGYSNGKMRE
jgi:hypothetical protein